MAVIRGEQSQFGEDAIIAAVFKGQAPGFVADIGAADGVNLSHSRALILAGWSALLTDPLPSHFDALLDLYRAEYPRVRVHHYAIGEAEGTATLWPALDDSFNSTMVESWRDLAISHGEHYGDPIPVTVVRLDTLFRHCGIERVDFLTIDAEQMDLPVLRSNDWARWRPKLVCAELNNPAGPMHEYMTGLGYKYLTHTPGSTFWTV